jgi:hypothetical protein
MRDIQLLFQVPEIILQPHITISKITFRAIYMRTPLILIQLTSLNRIIVPGFPVTIKKSFNPTHFVLFDNS